MASINFVDGTLVPDTWLNDIDALVWDVFNGATTDATARTNIGLGTGDSVTFLDLVLDQGAGDSAILSMRSSDVAHGMTDIATTTTYGFLGKAIAADGGTQLAGFSDATGALGLLGHATTENSTKSTLGTSPVFVASKLKSGTNAGALSAGANLFRIANNTLNVFLFDSNSNIYTFGGVSSDIFGNGLWFINDTANAGMTLGFTINQGANDDEILAFKSSDVAHGITDDTETDTYAFFRKVTAASGGLFIKGFTEVNIGAILEGNVTTEDTTKSSVALAAVEIRGTTKSGTASGSMGADANILAIRNDGTTRTIFDSDGDIWTAGSLTNSGGVATPAGGSTTARLLFGTTAGFGIYYGSGAPTVSAAQGSIYLRSDGSSTSTRLYVNTNGSTTWTNVTTAA